MANSRYHFHKEDEQLTDLRYNRGTFIIVRVDGDKFHKFSTAHNFHKPNDKRALDLMVESAKQVMRTYKGHIPLAYGHSDEFSFLIKSTSNLLSRRVFKITSMLVSVFTACYNNQWNYFFHDSSLGDPTSRQYDAWFDARPKEYPDYYSVIDYFRWRQIDCHINNTYNTTLHALTGRYQRHESLIKEDGTIKITRTSVRDWIKDESKFFSAKVATEKLSGTVTSDKHDIMFLDYKINYNNELEQFKKGTIVIDVQKDYNGENADPDSIKTLHVDITRSPSFWDENSHIFERYNGCPPTR